ncbi:hypothetical protein SAMN04488600_10613 [Paenibacillus polymyxa]|nr:hypothetical protein SAMN04488600_10613 [Paenibacillus polymyxa]
MKHTPTIRAELDRYLQQEGLSIAQFGHIAGINRGIVSAIVTGNKSMSVNQLDLMTEAMGLTAGCLKRMALLIVASSFLFLIIVPAHNYDQLIQTFVQIGGF